MREVADCLNDLFGVPVPDFIQENRENHRNRKTPENGVQAQEEGVPQSSAEIQGIKILRKMLQAHPFISQNTVSYFVILKCDQHSVHWYVAEDEDRDHCGKYHKKIVFVSVP